MRTVTKKELVKIIDLHQKWLKGEGGERANLSSANLRSADLSSANLRSANLSSADLSSAKNLLAIEDFINDSFKKTKDGIIVFKTFSEVYTQRDDWAIKPKSIIKETCNYNRVDECGCGINVATKEWIKKSTSKDEIWFCLIKWEWLCSVCVPYNTDGKIRTGILQLVKKYTRDEFNKLK